MPSNSQSPSRRLRSIQRMLRDARLGEQLTPEKFNRMESLLAECAGEVEQMEVASGSANVVSQLKAAGRNPVMLQAVLRQDAAFKGVRRG